MNVIQTLTAGEMALAEKTSGLSIATLEDPNFPKVSLLAALGWVYARRENPTMKYQEYADTHTLEQITEALGLNEEDDEESESDETPPVKLAQ